VLAEFRRVLKPGGGTAVQYLGPDTLVELRRSWGAADDYNHVNGFLDMHDIGDALIRARLAEPVMDVERLTLTYAEVDGLMGDLGALGARNVTAGRPRGLTGRGRLRAMREAYERYRAPTAAAGQLRGSVRSRLGAVAGMELPRAEVRRCFLCRGCAAGGVRYLVPGVRCQPCRAE